MKPHLKDGCSCGWEFSKIVYHFGFWLAFKCPAQYRALGGRRRCGDVRWRGGRVGGYLGWSCYISPPVVGRSGN